MHAVLDAGRRGDEGQVELSLQAFLHDLHVEQTEEPAPEAETERTRRLGRVGDAGVVQLQLLEALAQQFEVVAVDGEQPAEHHRLRIAIAMERFGGPVEEGGDGLTRTSLTDVLDARDEIADLARTEFGHRRGHWATHTDLDCFLWGARLHEQQLRCAVDAAVHHANARHHAAILVVLRVEDERLQRRLRVALGCRDAIDDGVEQVADTHTGLRRDAQDVFGRNAQHRFDLHRVAIGVGGGQVDLVERRDDLEIVLHGQVAVGQRLRLDPLGRIDHQHHALARRQAAADLVAEVDVAGRVDEVQRVPLPVDTYVLRLDGDATLALEIHRIEVLGAHVAHLDGARELQDAVAQRALAVVDVGDDGEIANSFEIHGRSLDPTGTGVRSEVGRQPCR